jgi:predicted aldo/keto reductase-like oxidoreductase
MGQAGHAQSFISMFILQQENVPVAITGANTPEQVVQNIDIPTLSQVFNCYFNHNSRYTKCS